MNAQFDIKRIHTLKDILIRLRHGATLESIETTFNAHFKNTSFIDVLLIELELINGDYGITVEDIQMFSKATRHIKKEGITSHTNDPSHPVQIFKEENIACQCLLDQINRQLETIEENQHLMKKTIKLEMLQHDIFLLEEFRKHFDRKEKLFFPIMERYGYHDPIRMVWRIDDRIRALYKAVKRQVMQLSEINLVHVRKTFTAFEKEIRHMIFQEEEIILPVLQSIFNEDDWLAIAKESAAFGYALIEPKEEWKDETLTEKSAEHSIDPNENIRFGGGYLTTEEANLILNNLPLEVTFVDKNSVFKYFNEITVASEMMLVRTPISIGRNVANCHPPKSLKKVMTLIRDLKTKKRTSESMWYKSDDKYIHLTYKALFNEKDEFMGILEYVQDIQPFFELPSEVKTGLSKFDESSNLLE